MTHNKALPNYGQLSHQVQSLLHNITWTGTSHLGSKLTYAFDHNKVHKSFTDLKPLNNNAKIAVRTALDSWENVANIKFLESDDCPNIIFRIAKLSNSDVGDAYVKHIENKIIFADIVLSEYTARHSNPGEEGFKTLLHEIGHSLGLKHPGKYNSNDLGPFLSSEEDSRAASVMSYNNPKFVGTNFYPSSPMIYDIAAIQFLYGPNVDFNSDSSKYSIKSDKQVFTIWDSGGDNDTIDASQGNHNSVIDLREGLSNMSKVGHTYFWIAQGSEIENIICGNGDDIIYGNHLNNTIHSGGGKDIIYPGSAINKIHLGKGPKTIVVEDYNEINNIHYINNFKIKNDKLDLKDLKKNKSESLKISFDKTGTTIELSTTKIILSGITEMILHEDFII